MINNLLTDIKQKYTEVLNYWKLNDKEKEFSTLSSILMKLDSKIIYNQFIHEVIPVMARIIQNKQMEKLFYIFDQELKLNKLASRVPGMYTLLEIKLS